MIAKALNLILHELNQFIPPVAGPEVVLGNIALHESPDQDELTNKLVICLVNVEEESTLKNKRHYIVQPPDVTYRNPPVNLNLYLLFSANYTTIKDPYQTSLERLSQVISFFQGKNTFTLANSPGAGLPEDEGLRNLRLVFELYTLTFEQINYLWGSLGGKQMPFVMYKARLVTIDTKRPLGGGKLIEEIQSKEKIS